MPSSHHEALIDLFRHRPQLAAELLAGSLGVALPDWQQARLDSAELTDLGPTEYRADAVVSFTADQKPALAVVVEVQMGRDRGKRRSWPVYLTTLHARVGCPVVLLVVCPDTTTAAWCASPIPLGHPGFVLTPLVVGPEQVPVVADIGQASESPEMAVLSAMAHGTHPDRDKVFYALLGALGNPDVTDPQRAALYADVVLAALPTAASQYL